MAVVLGFLFLQFSSWVFFLFVEERDSRAINWIIDLFFSFALFVSLCMTNSFLYLIWVIFTMSHAVGKFLLAKSFNHSTKTKNKNIYELLKKKGWFKKNEKIS